jgi:hypothetical protein
MLSLGNAFLCEEVFLKKIGASIDSHVENLREEILTLKMKFPGKFATEIDTDSALEDLRSHAQRLRNPTKGIIDKCTIGALGQEMGETLDELTTAIRTVKRKVEGEPPSYTAKDSVLGVLEKAKTPASMVSRLVSLSIKTVLILALLSVGPLIYLVLSLDRESALQKEIAETESYIRSQREIVFSSEQAREEVSKKIEDMRADDAPREVKVEMMELNVRLHGLDERRNRAEAEIANRNDKIKDMKRRLEQLRGKSLLDRLLRK